MINLLFKILSFCLLISSLSGLEIKAGYFFFSDSKMHAVYDKGGLDIQLSDSYSLWQPANGWSLAAYGAIEYFEKSGKSTHGHQRTSLWTLPINLGLKSFFMITTNMDYYIGLGPRLVYIHQHNNSSYVNKKLSGSCLGFFMNTGFQYTLCSGWLMDIFGEYSYAKIRLSSKRCHTYTKNMQVGGFTFGGGLSYAF